MDCSLDSEHILQVSSKYYKMSKFLHDDDNNSAKAIAVPMVFSKNSRAKNLENKAKDIPKNG